jgi:hypothetical protein
MLIYLVEGAPSWDELEVSSLEAQASLACDLSWAASFQEQVPLASFQEEEDPSSGIMGRPPMWGAGIIPGRGGPGRLGGDGIIAPA